MATFEVKAVKIDEVTDHPNADRLSMNRIGGFIAISNKVDGKHRYRAGDLVVYVPEGAVMPDYLLQRMGFWKDGKGMLAGSRGNRVKAIKLRGVVSQGIIVPTHFEPHVGSHYVDGAVDDIGVVEGGNYADALGIVKYEPPIPAGMSGDLIGSEMTLKFDVENGQKYPDVFRSDDYVCVTEKLHGTFAAFVFTDEPQPGWLEIRSGSLWATAYSKGLGSRGLVFKDTPKNRTSNLYVRALLNFIEDNDDAVALINDYLGEDMADGSKCHRVTFLGEIFGRGVQDLQYSKQAPEFAAFDFVFGSRYMSSEGFWKRVPVACQTVPVLYKGQFQDLDIPAVRDGVSSIDQSTLKEGVVVRAMDAEARNDIIGRKMVKYISPDYLTRKGGTELQ